MVLNVALFCARDQLGVKPFFTHSSAESMVFSNTLDCVRLHPGMSSELNDLAIADFLLFGANQESDITAFHDIRRLPPAYCLIGSREAITCRQYWTLPIDEPIVFKRAEDYTERFKELLRAAVSDRLRTRHVGVLMSGGLDSSSIAAVAAGVLRERSTDFTLQAITSVYDRLIPDGERHYARLVADHLNIPIHYDVRDDETSIADWDRLRVHTPEPVQNPAAFVAATEFSTKMPLARAGAVVRRGPRQRFAIRMASLPDRISWPAVVSARCSRGVRGSADAPARPVVGVDSRGGRRARSGEAMAASVSRLAQ